MLCKVDPNAKTIMDITFAKTFVPNDLSGLMIENYTPAEKKIIVVEGNLKYVHSIIYGKSVYFFRNPIA